MSNDVFAIIPAAGESRRFKDEGYFVPKPFLKIRYGGRTKPMLSHVIDSVSEDVYICAGVPQDSIPTSMSSITTRVMYQQIKNTIGQADTIHQILASFPALSPVLILDCDMVLRNTDISTLIHLINVYDVAVAVTTTFDPNASRVDTVPFPTLFVEKQPISEWGIVGARIFKHSGTLREALAVTLKDCEKKEIEPYLSMAINNYPGKKYAHVVTDFQDWGTPERVRASGATIET